MSLGFLGFWFLEGPLVDK
uniref:Uncharacterized protein n=1 Tax=Anguilla anguilla TaxID=7936 RepID=A0A0E9TQG4_ANGAN